jgi:omega-6 fatty acid desaturase (delta-12 desaturase)
MANAMTLESASLDAASEAPTATRDAAARESTPRDDKALLAATRDFVEEDRVTSWRHLITVVLCVAAAVAVAAVATSWPLRLAAAVLNGLLIVRLFIVYHDYMHGALLRGSSLAKVILSIYGVLVLAPPRIWKESHNYHHANTAKIIGSQIGSFPTATVGMWKKMTPKERVLYRIVRHPLTILFGYVPIFMLGMCVNSLRKSPSKYWDSGLALVVNWTLTALLVAKFGFATAAFTYLVPLMVACATGAYLFYAQHNFPDMVLQGRHEWTYTRAALESSSYMPMGPVMQWLTGNIGYHHVHHLNAQIPFYRLPDAMAAIPELQSPGETSLEPSDVWRCLQLKLWDSDQKRMVGYP